VGVGLLMVVGPQSLRSRVTSIWDLNNGSNAERIYLWISGAHMVADRPLTGFGPGVYEKVAGPYKAPYAKHIHYPDHEGFRTVSHAHNLYLMMAIQSGIPGLILFLAFSAAAFSAMARASDPSLRFAAMASFAAFLAGGIFEFNGGDAEVATLVFFLVGLALNRRE
jgi:O-antigen ligase